MAGSTASEIPTRLAVISSVEVVSVSKEMVEAFESTFARAESPAEESTTVTFKFVSRGDGRTAGLSGADGCSKRLNCPAGAGQMRRLSF